MMYVGIDAGGTKTRLLARCPGREDIALSGPGANLQVNGIEGAAQILTNLTRAAAELCPSAPVLHACAGVSGAGNAEERIALTNSWLEALGSLTPGKLTVLSDATIALEGAFEGGGGIILIAGTGSIIYAKTEDGALHRAGGWGYLLGDEASGFSLGLAGFKAVAAALDGGPATRLLQTFGDIFGAASRESLVHVVYREQGQAARFAPAVLEVAQDGDVVALELMRSQLASLAVQVVRLINRCGPIHKRIALMGGLSSNTFFRAAIEQKLLEQLPDWAICNPVHEPEAGALRIAMALSQQDRP